MGLFPLALVLLPGEAIPLHVFEERYKELFADLAADEEFGVIRADQGRLHEFGCGARLVEVTERFEDGRLNVLVRGSRRFRLLELKEPADLELSYLRGIVEFIDDTTSDAPPDLVVGVLNTFRTLLKMLGAEEPPLLEEAVPLSYRVGAAFDFGASTKQQLLESLSERRRLEALLAVMQTIVTRVEARGKLQERIRGNGKGV